MRLEARRRDRIFELAARLEPTYRQYRVHATCTIKGVHACIIKRWRNREGEKERRSDKGREEKKDETEEEEEDKE